MTYGLTADGFNRKRLIDIKDELETALKNVFGQNIDVSEESGWGQLIGIFAEALSDQWESQENVYNSQYPTTATKVNLSNSVSYNGLVRLDATYSTVSCTFSGTEGTPIPIGTNIATSDTGVIFTTTEENEISAGGTVDIPMQGQEKGSLVADAGTLTDIINPIFGLDSVTNTEAAIPGRNEETDIELRKRQEESTQASGKNNSDSLYGQLKNIDGVTDAIVLSNGLSVTDANGVPANQFEAIVVGGLEEDIVEVVWANTPQGILSNGVETATIKDDQGFDQTVKYTRATLVPVYFNVSITVDNDVFPATGEADIKNNFAEFGNEFHGISDNVYLVQFYTPLNKTPGIQEAFVQLGYTPGVLGTATLDMDVREMATFDAANIVVEFTTPE